jgi:hypothetical protein
MILTGTGIISSSSGAVATYIGTSLNTTTASDYTFSNTNLGSGGLLVVCVQAESGSAGRVIDSVEVGAGNTATEAVQRTSAFLTTSTIAGIFYTTDNATTKNILVSFSASVSRCFISIYRIGGLTSNIPVQTQSTTLTSGTGLTLPFTSLTTGSVGIAIETIGTDSVTSVAWTNATLDYNTSNPSGTRVTGADFRVDSTGSRSVSVSHSNSAQPITAAGAVWL